MLTEEENKTNENEPNETEQTGAEQNGDEQNGDEINADETNKNEINENEMNTKQGQEQEQEQEQQQEVVNMDKDIIKQEEKEQDELEEEESDPMNIDIDEGRWVSFIPFLTLTSATIIFAFVGMAIGLIIALAGENEEWVDKVDTNMMEVNISLMEAQNMSKTITNIKEIAVIDGEQYIIYYNTTTTTSSMCMPIEKLSDTAFKLIEFPGKIWIFALKLLVLPLIIIMMIILPSRVDQIGYVGKKAIPLYLFTSLSASIQGTIIVWIIQPGSIHRSENDCEISSGKTVPGADLTVTDTILNVFYNAVPDNIFVACSKFQIFGVIVFFLCLGLLLRNKNIVPINERNIVLMFNKAILRCIMKALVYVIWFSPIGIMSLIMLRVASTKDLPNLLTALGFYLVCIIIGMFLHLFIFYPIVMHLTVRNNAYKLFAVFYEAPLLAFATASSAATLPRSLQMAQKAGIRDSIYQFILPLGSAINMDGTAISFPIEVAFIAQLNDHPMNFATVFMIMILSVIVSVGTAPIPNAGIVYIVMLFEAAGLGQYSGSAIALLFVLDWLVGRLETAVNVSSDQYVAKIVDDIDQIEKANINNKDVKIVCGCCVKGRAKINDVTLSYDTVGNKSTGQEIQMQTI